jgi:hypothetical protein
MNKVISKKRIFQNQNCLYLFSHFLFSDLVDLPEIIDIKDEDDNDEEIVTKNTDINVQTNSFKTRSRSINQSIFHFLSLCDFSLSKVLFQK